MNENNEIHISSTREELKSILQELLQEIELPAQVPPSVDRIRGLLEKPYLTTAEAAELYPYSVAQFKKWRCSGDGPDTYRKDRLVVYTHKAIVDFIESHIRRSYRSNRRVMPHPKKRLF